MDTLFEMVRQVRGDMGERDPSMVLNADILGWIKEGAELTAREAKCYERESVFQAQDRVGTYSGEDVLPGYCGKIVEVFYRDVPCRLTSPRVGYEDVQTASQQPSAYHQDTHRFGLYPLPIVTNYSTGTASFVKGSTTVTMGGGADLSAAGVAFGWAIGQGSEPTKWYPILSADTDAGTLLLQEPFEETSAAGSSYVLTDGAVKVRYCGLPKVMNIYNYATGTVTFTLGSTAVVGVGTGWTTSVVLRAGMWIGKGGTSGSTIPTRWYRIKRVTDGTNLVLREPYDAVTAAAAAYVVSDPTPLPNMDYEPALFHARANCFLRYGERAEAERWTARRDAKILDVKRESAMRLSAGVGATTVELDGSDSDMWGGGSW